ncbi:MAG: molybdopterin-synthase adenylyltransferase MoeB [Kineosporiaceae bacterium]
MAESLSPELLQRYSRHILLPEVGLAGQQRLADARVLVVGAGGLGSPVLMYLAAAGVGTIGIVDFDVVDRSNLQRQVAHGESDVGRPKVDSAAETIAEINPHVVVERHPVRLGVDNACELIGRYDLVLDGSDNFATRYLTDDACWLTGVPRVWGSVFRFEGQVSVFADGVRYRDLYPEAPPPGVSPSCAEAGVMGSLCATVGSLMVTEAVKLITGAGRPLIGRLLVYDALAVSWRVFPVSRRPDVPAVTELSEEAPVACALPSAAAPTEVPLISTAELAELLRRGPVSLVDVREPGEAAVVSIDGSRLVPLGSLLDGAAVPAAEGPLVVYCKAGTRSARAARALLDRGHSDVRSLDGGVLAWVRDVEPHKPAY